MTRAGREQILDEPVCGVPRLAELIWHAAPLAQCMGHVVLARKHLQERQMMRSANGPGAERLAGCYHECGHIVVAVCAGGIPAGMVIDQGENAHADRALLIRNEDGSMAVLDRSWTWRRELLVTAAGAPSKARYRRLAGQFSIGLDGAAGDIGKFEFLSTLLLAEQNFNRVRRFLEESPTARVDRLFSLLDQQVAAVRDSLGDAFTGKVARPPGLEEIFREAALTPIVEAELRFLGRMAPPGRPDSPLWRKFVAEASRILDISWVWRSVESLAALLNEKVEVPAEETVAVIVHEARTASERGEAADMKTLEGVAGALPDISTEEERDSNPDEPAEN